MQGVETQSPPPVIYLRGFDRNSSLDSTNNQRGIAGNIDGVDQLRGDDIRSGIGEAGDSRAVRNLSSQISFSKSSLAGTKKLTLPTKTFSAGGFETSKVDRPR
jgi:hypothetical protein